MGQDALFDPTPDAPVGGRCEHVPALRVGQRFRFLGFPGQDAYEMPLPSSGSVGWFIEVNALSPWGTVSVRCTPDLDDSAKGQFTSVALSDVFAMIQSGAWEPAAE